MNKGILYALLVVVLGFLLWNVFLMNKLAQLQDDQVELRTKLDFCNGELEVLAYDLETANDSVRILNSEIETIVGAQ